MLFDMGSSRWTIDASSGRCVLQFWSEERNLVRTVLGLVARRGYPAAGGEAVWADAAAGSAAGAGSRPANADRPRRGRRQYMQLLARVLARSFPEWKQASLSSTADLEHSFGPAHVRGLLERGQGAWAVVGINAEESQSAIDALLTVAVLWLDHCRARAGGRRVLAGVKVVAPAGMAATVRERMAWLNRNLARWELYELDEVREELTLSDDAPAGNLRSQLVPAFDREAALERLRVATEQVLAILAEDKRARVEVLPRSPTEISFRLHGLEFARARHGCERNLIRARDADYFWRGGERDAAKRED